MATLHIRIMPGILIFKKYVSKLGQVQKWNKDT